MGFLSDLFSPSKSKSKSKPAPPTANQLALQKQAIDIGALQVGNVRAQTDFQGGLFERLMSRLNREQTVDRNLFGGGPAPPGPREGERVAFKQKQAQDLEAFKRQLSGGGSGGGGSGPGQFPPFDLSKLGPLSR